MGDNQVYDITFIGGGPVGLYGAFYAGMRKAKTKIIESVGQLGGQLAALYPEKDIYDVAGFPKVLAKDLVARCIEQGLQFNPTVCLNERVMVLETDANGIIHLSTNKGEHLSRTVILTVGLGAFSPRKLGCPGEETYGEKGVYYAVPDPSILAGKRVMIIGGGDSAVDWALLLEKVAQSVTLVHRREGFRAHEESVEKLHHSSVEVKVFYELKEIHGDGEQVTGATIFENRTKAEETREVDAVVLSLGFLSSLGPIHDWGLALEGNSIITNSKMETNLPGVYAAGDVCTYPGKIKLIATGFGEVATAVNNAKVFLDPTAKVFPGHSSSGHGH